MLNINWQLIIVVLLGVFFLGMLLYFLVTKAKGGSRPEWQHKVLAKMSAVNPSIMQPQLYLIEADKLLEFTLQNHFKMPAQSLGNILKLKSKSFAKYDLDRIWNAHKTRNLLVHDLNAKASPVELQHHGKVLLGVITKLIG